MDQIHELSEAQLWDRLGEIVGRDRLEVLWELGDRFGSRGDDSAALALFEQVEAEAHELQDELLVARARHCQGAIAIGRGETQTAAERYGLAAHGFNDLGRTTEAARSLWCQADSLRLAKDFGGCLKAAEQSRSLAEADEEWTCAGDACAEQAHALYQLDREREALAACAVGRDHFRRAGDIEKVRMIDDFAVTVHLFLGQLDEALEIAAACLVLSRQSDGAGAEATARFRLAMVHAHRGELSTALDLAEQARAEFQSSGDPVSVARCQRLRGDVLVDLHKPRKAVAAYEEARVLYEAAGLDAEAFLCGAGRASAMHATGDFREAARLNAGLIATHRDRGVGTANAAHWSVVRLHDNLLQDARFDDCVEALDAFRDLWPKSVSTAVQSYRECLGFQAAALAELGRTEEAVKLAAAVIKATPSAERTLATALCYEVRGRARLAEGRPSAQIDLSRALALQVTSGTYGRALALAKLVAADQTG